MTCVRAPGATLVATGLLGAMLADFSARRAVRPMSTPVSAFDTGQFALAVSAWAAKLVESSPGTSPSVASSMRLIPKPLPPRSMLTFATVSIQFGV